MSWCCGCVLWLLGWLVPVLGQTLTQSRVLCKGVDGDRSAPPSTSDFDSWPSAHVSPLTAWTVDRACVRCVYTPCKSLQVKPRVGQPSLCTLYTQP